MPLFDAGMNCGLVYRYELLVLHCREVFVAERLLPVARRFNAGDGVSFFMMRRVATLAAALVSGFVTGLVSGSISFHFVATRRRFGLVTRCPGVETPGYRHGVATRPNTGVGRNTTKHPRRPQRDQTPASVATRRRQSSPDVAFIKFHSMSFEQRPVLVLKRRPLVVLPLVSDIGLDGLQIRSTDRERSVSVLPTEPCQIRKRVVHPFR